MLLHEVLNVKFSIANLCMHAFFELVVLSFIMCEVLDFKKWWVHILFGSGGVGVLIDGSGRHPDSDFAVKW